VVIGAARAYIWAQIDFGRRSVWPLGVWFCGSWEEMEKLLFDNDGICVTIEQNWKYSATVSISWNSFLSQK